MQTTTTTSRSNDWVGRLQAIKEKSVIHGEEVFQPNSSADRCRVAAGVDRTGVGVVEDVAVVGVVGLLVLKRSTVPPIGDGGLVSRRPQVSIS